VIKVVAIGKLKDKGTQSLIEEYQKRLKPIHKVTLKELEPCKKKKASIDEIINEESARLLAEIGVQDHVVLLDLKGKMFSSESLSSYIDDKTSKGLQVVFVIGGSHGVNQSVRDRANFRWQISELTFTHQFVRVILYEQIYRSFMIIGNHPYHK